MAAMIGSQLDFIFFFYGLAFILLGATCFAIRGRTQGKAWGTLGLFGFVHGIGEWLDLSALVLGDGQLFTWVRTSVMAASFVFLLEFARQEGISRGLRLPGRWALFVPVMLVAFAGIAGDASAANVVARYAIGFVGALGSGFFFAWRATERSGAARRLSIFAAAGFVLYAIAAGVVVPAASFWPADILNQNSFVQFSHIPIQLIRGMLACWIAYAVWALWATKLIEQVSSEAYTIYFRRQLVWTLLAMAIILAGGWTLTEVLGEIYKQNVEREANGDIDLLASRLAGETASVKGMVKALGGSRSVRGLLGGGRAEDRERAQAVLKLDVDASGAEQGYILDQAGMVIASSSVQASDGSEPVDFSGFSFFQTAMHGTPGYEFASGAADRNSTFSASYPVRATDGTVIGVAVLTKSLKAFETDLRGFDRPYFLVDSDGVVAVTNRPGMLSRPLWPPSVQRQAVPVRQTGDPGAAPVLASEIVDATWINIFGTRDFARRRFAEHSQWSLVMLKPTQEIFASRVLGIVITFLVTIMALIYLSGRERLVHDQVQMGKRLKLQELARDLRFQANTDPLTGLYNRLRLNQALQDEVLRAERYKTRLSIIIFDVDRFKQVNDTYGHQAGDNVLVRIADIASKQMRGVDVLARWGGEEFVILLPETNGKMAQQVAEKLRAAIADALFDVGATTCSFGVAAYIDGDTAETLLARADIGLYRAKLNGRNRVGFVDPPATAPGFASVA